MNRIIFYCLASMLFISSNLYAADGDLIVNGIVSIGTTTPTASLSIKGNFTKALTGTVSVTQSSYHVIGTGTLFMTELQVNDSIMIASQIYTVSYVISDTELFIDFLGYRGEPASGLTAYKDTNNLLSVDDGAGRKIITVSHGKVGIGTASPSYTLDVAGTIRATSISGTVSKATNADKLLGNGSYRSAATANTANTIVQRDASGNFAAGTITAHVNGNLTGNVTGNVYGDADTVDGKHILVSDSFTYNIEPGGAYSINIGNYEGNMAWSISAEELYDGKLIAIYNAQTGNISLYSMDWSKTCQGTFYFTIVSR